MKKFFLSFSIVFLILSLPLSSFAKFHNTNTDTSDYYIVLQNKKYLYEYALNKGDYIIFDTSAGKRYKGVIEDISPEEIQVNGEKHKIKDLQYIKKTRKKLRNWSLGTSLPYFLVLGVGLASLTIDDNGFFFGNEILNFILVLLAAIAYLATIASIILWLVLLTSNVFNANLKKFNIKVKKNNSK